jgi:PKD repeat protein
MNKPTLLSIFAWTAILATDLAAQTTFSDDFERPDGAVEGWTTATGDWSIAAGRLQGINAAAEPTIWAGDPALRATDDFTVRFDLGFESTPGDAVGRHGGVLFAGSVATNRYDPAFSGYSIDWIDRVDDHGFRLIRIDGGVQTVLVGGTFDILDPPSEWEIELSADLIILRSGGDEIFAISDDTHREGHFGFWAWTNGSQLLVDNFEIDYTPTTIHSCFTTDTRRGGSPLTVNFDASCSLSTTPITAYEWDFGDGQSGTGESVSHLYDFPDTYIATLTLRNQAGGTSTSTVTIEVIEVVGEFIDTFDRADGPVDGWTVYQGEWNIADEQLTALAVGQEFWLWAGDPAVNTENDFEVNLDYEFLEIPGDGVGRHAGIMFASTGPTIRWEQSGYTIDWIDRAEDHGFRFIRWDNGAPVTLVNGTPAIADPPIEWRVVIGGDLISFYGDGELIFQQNDATHRGGYFGLWAYSSGTSIAIDDVDLTLGPEQFLGPCFSVAPGASAPIGTELTFDASCTVARGLTVTSYAWDFGDGGSASGEAAEHTYAAAGSYEVKLTVTGSDGSMAEFKQTVEAFELVEAFSDDFERDDGPVDGWTVFQGDWRIEGGALRSESIGTELWIWAGEPAARFADVPSIEFRYEFVEPPLDAIGRHGGVMFYASKAINRGGQGMNGYTLDWIDRDIDLGFRVIRWDNGVGTTLLNGTGALDPGETWRIETDGDTLRFYSDDELITEIVDATYRQGHVGFWAYSNTQVISIDDVVIGSEAPPVGTKFVRGDADASGSRNITDGIFILNFLFLGGTDPTCRDSADADDSGTVNITDGIYVLNFLFLGGADPLPPNGACGLDPTEETLDCVAFAPCA